MANQTRMATPQGRLVVVDPHMDDYHCLLQPARKHLVRLTLTTTGSNALRLLPSFADALWLLSPQLPDMNGLDLLDMLRSLQRKLDVVVVDKLYDPRRERRALELRAAQYVCKPVQLAWLKAWWDAPVAVQDRASFASDPMIRNIRFYQSPELRLFINGESSQEGETYEHDHLDQLRHLRARRHGTK